MTGLFMVILNWHDEESTANCIKSLGSDPSITTIIVVDNESTGAMRTELERRKPVVSAEIELLELPENRGFAGGVNVGIARAVDSGAEYIGTINNDATLYAGSFASLCEELADNPHRLLVAPRLQNQCGEQIPSELWFTPILGTVTEFPKSALRSFPFLTWACVIMRSETFRHLGSVDDAFFMYWEDVDFCVRNAHGRDSLGVVRGTVVEHRVSSSHSRVSWQIDFYSAFGHAVITQRCGGTAWVGLILRSFLRIGKRLANGDIDALKATIGGTLRGLRRSRKANPAWQILYDVTGTPQH